ncbi:MAG: T9SS type A sorting domain-containing protein [Chitinophagaceae bacterium]
MYRIFVTLFLLLPVSLFAQFVVGGSGITVRNGATLTIDSLVLQPAADITIENNRLTHRYTPVPGSPNASVKRVYEWDVPILITGNLQMYIANPELNGNILATLQLAHSPLTGNDGFITSTTSSVNMADNSISNNFSTTTIKQLTAVSSSSALPLKWLSFTAKKVDRTAQLDWKISEEENVNGYEVQRSAEGQLYETIAFVPATCNNCGPQEVNYTYADMQPFSGTNFYRIKEVDINGFSSYSRVQLVVFDNALNEIKAGPNPADKFVQLFNLETSKKYSITLLSINGVVLKKESVENKNTCIIETERLPAGAYIILIETADKRIQKIVRVMR